MLAVAVVHSSVSYGVAPEMALASNIPGAARGRPLHLPSPLESGGWKQHVRRAQPRVMFDAAFRTDSAGVSAASALVGASVAVDKSSRRRVVDVVGASVQLFASASDKCSCRRVLDVVGASASLQQLKVQGSASSRIGCYECRLLRQGRVQRGRVQTNAERDQKHEFVESHR